MSLEMFKFGFIGVGNMASAIIAGLLKAQVVDKANFITSTKSAESAKKIKDRFAIECINDNKLVANSSDILFLCVKPYMIKDLANEISKSIKKETIIISVLASVSLEKLMEHFPNNNIIRVMPNTSSEICLGVTSIVQDKTTDIHSLKIAEDIFKKLGSAYIIEESKIHAYNAMAGCGPAYVYKLIDAFAEAGTLSGIPKKVAIEIAAKVFNGASSTLLETGSHPSILKDSICTPGGITIKGIREFEASNVTSGIIETIYAAYSASIESEKNS